MNDDEKPDLSAWTAEEPPAGFAERVMEARRSGRRGAAGLPRATISPRALVARLGIGVAVLAGLGVGGGLILRSLGRSPTVPARGSLVAIERTTLGIGTRAIAVAEPAADLSWNVKADDARVVQPAGDVFYRVEPGGPFVVATPAGDVIVKGTCFRVEVSEMKPSKSAITGAVVGAALTATVMVTVYEGRVLLANEKGKTEIKAGERASVSAGGAPDAVVALRDHAQGPVAGKSIAVPVPPGPPDNATREELLQRDRAQREELAKLRAEVATLESRPGKHKGLDDGSPFFAPSKDELLDMAKSCTVKYDVPPLNADGHDFMTNAQATALNITSDEHATLDKTLADMQARAVAQLRTLYAQITGNPTDGENMTPMALEQEIQEKSPDLDRDSVMATLSQERAGLIPPPANPASRPPVEQMYRMLTAFGDQVEQQFATVIGPDRAHALRAANDGWGMHFQSSGCKDDENQKATGP